MNHADATHILTNSKQLLAGSDELKNRKQSWAYIAVFCEVDTALVNDETSNLLLSCQTVQLTMLVSIAVTHQLTVVISMTVSNA